MNNSKIKICGIKTIDTLKCCIKNQVTFFGLIFYKKSPRFININDALNLLNYSQNKKIYSVGVFVNKKIDNLNQLLKKLKFNYLQLHGNENNEYIKYIKDNNDIKVIKAIPIRSSKDLLNLSNYSNADIYLFDYKPLDNELPGGNAKNFNWELMKNIQINKKWFLSGGININNILNIKHFTIPYGIDISSGVEVKPGIKSNDKIKSLTKLYGSK